MRTCQDLKLSKPRKKVPDPTCEQREFETNKANCARFITNQEQGTLMTPQTPWLMLNRAVRLIKEFREQRPEEVIRIEHMPG